MSLVDRARPAVPGSPTLAGDRLLPSLPALTSLLPGGGLQRGSTVAVGGRGDGGAVSLGLALLAGPSAEGSWCAIAGLPELGLLAASGLGIQLRRLALVPDPGSRWGTVMAALLDGFEVVLARPPARVGLTEARRLTARARQRDAVLVIMGGASATWPLSPDLSLAVEAGEWVGPGDGYGHLRCRRVSVVARGRRQAAKQVRASLWLPSPSGTVAFVEEEEVAPGVLAPSQAPLKVARSG